MNYSEMMKEEGQSPHAKLTELLQTDYKRCNKIIAVEGPDDTLFYHDYLKSESDSFFICDGKKGVLGLSVAAREYDLELFEKIVFICDKDFDDYLKKLQDEIKYTKFYSIESYLCLSQFASYILNKYCTTQISLDQKNKFIQNFESLFLDASKELIEICSLMLEVKNKNFDAKFDNTSINDFIDENFKKKDINLDFLENKWEIKNLQELDYSKWIEIIKDHDFKLWIRGKYLIQLAKKIFDFFYKKILNKKTCEISNKYGKEGFNIIKLAIPEILYLYKE